VDGVVLEQSLREAGLALVFQDRVCEPIPRGSRPQLEDLLVSLLDYNYAGEYRTELARKIINAQIALARRGYSTGGRPPHGFERWLVKDDGTQVRRLEDGEHVRMAGHHVVWLPGAEEKLRLNRRIIDMLKKMPASRVAGTLTAEGIPSPDAGRMRKDNGVRHQVSGVWHQNTIIYIARNPLLAAIASYGRRSMGDQLRFSPDGPRRLDETQDFGRDKQCKVVLNPDASQIRTPSKFQPLISVEERRELLQVLDKRGGTQRNKPRSHDPAKNPLGGCVFDMKCGWPMYRQPYGQTFRYTCGLYQQSHGQKCEHNHH
jgi:Recombinase